MLNVNEPAQLTGDVNDYDPGDYDLLRMTSNGNRTITGISGGVPGRVLILYNSGSKTWTLRYDKTKTKAVMEDYSSGHITTDEAAVLIREIDKSFRNDSIRFYPGVSYRHLMVWKDGAQDMECVPPHDIQGREIIDYLPSGIGEETLRNLMHSSVDILSVHDVNRSRVERGKRPANSIWFWGQGRAPRIPKFKEKFGMDGALVSAVDLTKGLGICAGLEILKVPGVTGYLDTNYVGKADYSIDALGRVDFVYIHVEAPDEAGHSGNCADKVRAIEDFDRLVVGTVIERIAFFDEYRLLIMPDHATPIEVRTHTDEPIPFIIYDSRRKRNNEGAAYNESLLRRSDIVVIEEGHRLMEYFIRAD